jgi:hypothetical protein
MGWISRLFIIPLDTGLITAKLPDREVFQLNGGKEDGIMGSSGSNYSDIGKHRWCYGIKRDILQYQQPPTITMYRVGRFHPHSFTTSYYPLDIRADD